jgi:hypothetical protein
MTMMMMDLWIIGRRGSEADKKLLMKGRNRSMKEKLQPL